MTAGELCAGDRWTLADAADAMRTIGRRSWRKVPGRGRGCYTVSLLARQRDRPMHSVREPLPPVGPRAAGTSASRATTADRPRGLCPSAEGNRYDPPLPRADQHRLRRPLPLPPPALPHGWPHLAPER
jgi:hypothetical protein